MVSVTDLALESEWVPGLGLAWAWAWGLEWEPGWASDSVPVLVWGKASAMHPGLALAPNSTVLASVFLMAMVLEPVALGSN